MNRKSLTKILYLLFSLLSLLILPSCFEQNLEAKILMRPYLQAVTQNSIYVMVESNTKDTVYVMYSEDDTMTDFEAKTSFYIETKGKRKNTYIHRIKLENLKPNTRYNYKAIQEGKTVDGGSFKTAALEGESFKIAVMGDTRSNTDIHSIVSKEMQKHNPDFSLYLGDLCFSMEYYSWKNEFFIEPELELSSSVPFFNAVGNHEGWEENGKAFLQAPESPSEKQDYYSFDYGDLHVLVINNELPCNIGSEQYAFADMDLKGTSQKWKIVISHKPAYSGGGHGENDDMIEMAKNIFVPNKVNFVLSAHNHFYQSNMIDGVRHITIAGGGAPLYEPAKKEYTIKSVKTHCYGIIDVTKDSLKLTAYDIYNKIIDEIVIEDK